MCVQGAQEVFKELPHEYVSPYDLKDVAENGGTCMYNHEYICVTLTLNNAATYVHVRNVLKKLLAGCLLQNL